MLFRGGGDTRRRNGFVYNMEHVTVDSGETYIVGAIRHGPWKLLNFDGELPLLPKGTFELYNLKDDPGESNDVFDEHPEIAQGLVKEFWVRHRFIDLHGDNLYAA